MPTPILLEVNEKEFLEFFARQTKVVEGPPDDSDEFMFLKMKDGNVYVFNGIYVMTNSENRAFQIITVRPEQFGITLIDTKETSKTKKRLVQQIEIFITRLHRAIMGLKGSDNLLSKEFPDNSIDDIRESILKDNSLI